MDTLESTTRLLRLLSLLRSRPEQRSDPEQQSRSKRRDRADRPLPPDAPGWTGPRLAAHLGVSPRTVRRDVQRLRAAGYPVRGSSGGYRLDAGGPSPPPLLDDDEAVAIVTGLRTAVGGTVAGIEPTSARALAKLEQALPARVRHRVDALDAVTVSLPVCGETVAPADLAAIAAACRSARTLRFDYRTHDGREAVRTAEPHRIACTGRRWYLLAWDLDRTDWRTYRVDRIRLRPPTGPRFAPRPLPDRDIAAYIRAGISTHAFAHHATVLLHASPELAAARIGATDGVLEAIDTRTCRLTTGASSIDALAIRLAFLDLDFTVESPPELLHRVARLAGRWSRAAG
ncbi:helix-turn-helix transcriptional regulator [Embleya scabrispora]|uniref:helix-turn-helix transcriptional regulator n=1 Tax=Embleya scabrispora TaxID=159449 RepID=UPI00036BCE34|nr:WYL domain-containing protein [Embleya scabrispora]MYS80944.1 WYL domain-containing protein [Streptomyces sp. SID5474]